MYTLQGILKVAGYSFDRRKVLENFEKLIGNTDGFVNVLVDYFETLHQILNLYDELLGIWRPYRGNRRAFVITGKTPFWFYALASAVYSTKVNIKNLDTGGLASAYFRIALVGGDISRRPDRELENMWTDLCKWVSGGCRKADIDGVLFKDKKDYHKGRILSEINQSGLDSLMDIKTLFMLTRWHAWENGKLLNSVFMINVVGCVFGNGAACEPLDVHHLFPQKDYKDFKNRVANMIFVSTCYNRTWKDKKPSEYVKDQIVKNPGQQYFEYASSARCKKCSGKGPARLVNVAVPQNVPAVTGNRHTDFALYLNFINGNALSALKSDDVQQFIDEREKEIKKALEKLL